jgi:putative transcriptional regulator
MNTRKLKSRSVRHRQRTNGETGRETSAGARILAAIEEATDLLRNEGLGSKRLTVRTYKTAPTPRAYQAGDVKRVREQLGVSQAVLAAFLGVNINTVRSWEQGKRPPQPIACRFLAELESAPEYWRQRIAHNPIGLESES